MERRSVEVVWGTRETVAVRGLDEGDQVITSAVPTPIEGMPVQVQSPSAAEAEQDDPPETL